MSYDIAIIGGGIIGSAVAYFLARTHQAGSLAVIEPDPSYRLAATPQGAGGVRGLFSLPENIWMSRYSLDFYASFAQTMAVDGEQPEIDAVRCKRTWTGHYAQNMLDGNMILGPWVGGATNFYVACGFSGHGTMHAPAVGLVLSELILDGAYSTMDLERMSYQRVLDNTPYREQGII
jgi:glycine/D-amino acid oxidase-like deaminating enzyme